MNPIKIVQYGLGPIGLATVRAVLEKSATIPLKLVGAIDIDPAKVSRDVGSLLSDPVVTGVLVSDNASDVLTATKPDVVLHTTSSFLDAVSNQLTLCARAGAHVISSTEELSFPYERHPSLAATIDQEAKKHGTVILGTGVNPGYAMDTLALTATGVCLHVDRLQVERVVDASKRRLSLQRKVGAGLSVEDFEQKKQTGTFGHIGLRESLLLVADGLGWKLEEIHESLDPVVARRLVETPFLTVEPGEVAGIHHAIYGTVDGRNVLSLDLKMYVGADNPRDAVFVTGDPPIDLVIRNGIFGDTATVAALINAIPLVMNAAPGLRTMKDIPIPRVFSPTPNGRR